MFNGIKDSLFKWGASQAGAMPTPDYMIEGEFDEDVFAETRENKLGKLFNCIKYLASLLSNEIQESEGKW